MSTRPESFMPLWIADYLADTMHLTARQHGEYLLLLMFSWKQDRPLPKVDASLRAIARASESEWAEDREIVLAFFQEGQDGYRQKRLEEERAEAVERFNSLKRKSQLGHEAKSRLRKTRDNLPEVVPEAIPEACTSHISHISKDISILSVSAKTDGYSADFQTFWKAYPKTENMSKSAAFKAWQRVKSSIPDTPTLLAILAKYRAFLDAETRRQGRTYPAKHAQGWLSERRWEGYETQENSVNSQAKHEEDWADSIPEWNSFKALTSPTEWATWFSRTHPNGSIDTLIVPSKFTAEKIQEKYGHRLQAHFGEGFNIRVKQ